MNQTIGQHIVVKYHMDATYPLQERYQRMAAEIDAAIAAVSGGSAYCDKRRQAIAVIEDSRETHVDWARWLEKHPDDPRAKDVGDAQFHRECIQRYDFVLSVLKSAGERCGFVPPTPGYAPCTREKGHGGPCAHALA